VTVFFAKDVGPAKGGPEDHPERLVTLSPPHPGAFTWLDARTLQFRPAEPWPPLARFAWAARETKARLTTLMAAPSNAIPANDAAAESFAEVAFATAEPFRVVELGCRAAGDSEERHRAYPVTPEGARYTEAQALGCPAGSRTLLLEFSTAPRDIGPVEGRNLVRFTPAVDDLSFSVEGKTLVVAGDFAAEKPYRVTLTPAAVTDVQGRSLEMTGESELWVYFPRQPSYLGWRAAQGLVERFGPQMVPLDGRGKERLDLRLHR